MPYGLQITVEDVTRTENCNGDICLKDNVSLRGAEAVAAGMLGIAERERLKVHIQ